MREVKILYEVTDTNSFNELIKGKISKKEFIKRNKMKEEKKLTRYVINGQFFKSKADAFIYAQSNKWIIEKWEEIILKTGNKTILGHIMPSIEEQRKE